MSLLAGGNFLRGVSFVEKTMLLQNPCSMWWYMSVIPILRRWEQEDYKFVASLDYIVRVCLDIREHSSF